MTPAVQPAGPRDGQARCWCCDSEYPTDQLLSLGAHPEATICPGCATWLHRRATQVRDRDRAAGPGVLLRRVITRLRDGVITRGIHDWPGVGRMLRAIDRRLP